MPDLRPCLSTTTYPRLRTLVSVKTYRRSFHDMATWLLGSVGSVGRVGRGTIRTRRLHRCLLRAVCGWLDRLLVPLERGSVMGLLLGRALSPNRTAR